MSKYLDSPVARINAPRLRDIDVTFFNQPTLDASQPGLFINRTEMRKSSLRAELLFYGDSISITFTQPGTSTRLGLQISYEQLDWRPQLRPRHHDDWTMPDDMDDEQWQGLIRVFDGATDFCVVGEFATEIVHASRPADEMHDTPCGSFMGVVGRPPVPDSAIHEYIRNLEYLDMVLGNIERYIHIAFGALEDEDVVRRMFTMVNGPYQIPAGGEYVLDLYAIRGIIQEADNMDQRLTAVLGVRSAVPHQSQQPPRPTPSFTQPAPAAAPLVTIAGPSPWSGNVDTATAGSKRLHFDSASGDTCLHLPPSPKREGCIETECPSSLQGINKANSLETTSSAPAVTPTPMSLDTKANAKRVWEDEADNATPGVTS
ncbi:hypothetical protein EDB92DRAFT_1943532 [Lactarius akahatsu]|uniref:Uncharacterized protein n=1 Tax=Lactarius akahatsu TaxID=416441 RepID=A0AAD4QF38_9AGAM|nr:hypothetical protein EDB92DRAFT_1943532 [Lactarius akahatsu]